KAGTHTLNHSRKKTGKIDPSQQTDGETQRQGTWATLLSSCNRSHRFESPKVRTVCQRIRYQRNSGTLKESSATRKINSLNVKGLHARRLDHIPFRLKIRVSASIPSLATNPSRCQLPACTHS